MVSAVGAERFGPGSLFIRCSCNFWLKICVDGHFLWFPGGAPGHHFYFLISSEVMPGPFLLISEASTSRAGPDFIIFNNFPVLIFVAAKP